MYNPIPEYIREIDELSLTKWGQIKLVGFNEAAIVHARSVLKRSKSHFKNFAFLFSTAHKYSKENNLPVNFSKVDYLKQHFGMLEDAPMELPQPKPPVAPPPRPSADNYFQELADRIAQLSKEDAYEAALRVERHLEFTEDGKRFVTHCGKINPWMEKLQKEDQLRILEAITNERTL